MGKAEKASDASGVINSLSGCHFHVNCTAAWLRQLRRGGQGWQAKNMKSSPVCKASPQRAESRGDKKAKKCDRWQISRIFIIKQRENRQENSI
jgi:hypothetical protein